MVKKGTNGMSYTRDKYIHGAPPPKISKFTMGDAGEKFEYTASLVTPREAQISHNALESARIAANKVLLDKLGDAGYCLRICVYPHHIVREHKFMGFAGADRISEGMRRAFGKPTGRAARVKQNQAIIAIDINEEEINLAKEALRRAASKLPIPCQIVIQKTEK